MTKCLAGLVTSAAFVLAPLAASAEPIPPACVVVDVAPVHAQVGYAPNGPSDCVVLPG